MKVNSPPFGTVSSSLSRGVDPANVHFLSSSSQTVTSRSPTRPLASYLDIAGEEL